MHSANAPMSKVNTLVQHRIDKAGVGPPPPRVSAEDLPAVAGCVCPIPDIGTGIFYRRFVCSNCYRCYEYLREPEPGWQRVA